jgi:uncharacterized protein YsxB (DUF464 family)
MIAVRVLQDTSGRILEMHSEGHAPTIICAHVSAAMQIALVGVARAFGAADVTPGFSGGKAGEGRFSVLATPQAWGASPKCSPELVTEAVLTYLFELQRTSPDDVTVTVETQ